MPDPVDLAKERRRVTMRDVARRAGVGTITVSRALAEPEKVSPELRRRIAAAVAELGYLPNHMAGGLSSQRTRVVPVIVPSIRNAVFADLVEGVNDVLLGEGYQILLGASGYDPAREEALISAFLGWFPAGIVVVGTQHTELGARLLTRTEATVVELFELSSDAVEINIGFSNAAAARDMTAHLLDEGYRRVAFVGAFMERDVRAGVRRSGYEEVLAGHGLPARVLSYPQPSSYELGGQAVQDLFARWPDTDAVFFANDVLAFGAITECQKRGIPVPQRLAIAGFNGLDVGARMTPELTTVLSPRREMGRQAARAILGRRGPGAKRREVIDLKYEILVRASTRRRRED